MQNILLISDQPRLHRILTAAGTLPDCAIRIVTSLEKGLEEIGSKSPDILFLQNRLSGLSGLILVRHVREQSGTPAPRIVLLGDGGAEAGKSGADIDLDTKAPDTELSDAVAEIIAEQFDHTPRIPDSIPPVGPDMTAGAASLSIDVSDTVSLSSSQPRKTTGTPLQQSLPAGNPGVSHPDSIQPKQATVLSSTPPPIQWERKRLIVASSILATLLLAAGGGYLLFRNSGRTPTVPSTTKPLQNTPGKSLQQALTSSRAETAKTPAPPLRLPPFVTIGGRDPAYPVNNPGWERYTSARHEFKLFQENGTVRAVQIIDRTSNGITPSFFTKVIREMSGVRDYRLETREQKGEFIVKKGRLGSSGRVIIYKNSTDTRLHAFVIDLSSSGTLPGTKETR